MGVEYGHRVYTRRAHDSDGHTVVELGAQRLEEASDGKLGAAVGHAVGQADLAGYAGHDQDLPGGAAQVRQGVARAVHVAVEVGVHDAAEGVQVWQLLEVAVRVDAGIEHEHVDAAVEAHTLLDECLAALLARDVADHVLRRGAEALAELRDLAKLGLGAGGEQQPTWVGRVLCCT